MFPLIPIMPGPNVIPGVPIGWYGLGYVIGVTVLLLVSQREAERRGIAPSHIMGALLLVMVLALVGGRMYHVIDQWHLYAANPISIFLPPYSGLGLFGGILGALVGIIVYALWKHLPVRLSIDSVIAGAFFAQAIARWGNFFNQELYGPPTDLPWGIAIDCAHRVAQYPCSLYPLETTGFHPLFFYESMLNLAGGLIVLYLSKRHLSRLQPGDLAAFWGIWYGATRFLLEFFREGWNWTVGGIPTAQLVSVGVILIGVIWLVWNHRPGTKPYEYAAYVPPEAPPPTESTDLDESIDDEDGVDDLVEPDDGGTSPVLPKPTD